MLKREGKTRISFRLENSLILFLDSMRDGIKIQDRTSALRAHIVDSKEYQEWKRKQAREGQKRHD